MNDNKKSKLPLLLGVAAFEAYRFYKGKGVFNKVRYKKQHEAVCNYIETHYPGAFYSELAPTESGWSCVITYGRTKKVLHLTKTDSDMFVFWEKDF